MNRTRSSVVAAACAIIALAIVATPATHPYLRRIAYDAGILHPAPPLHTGEKFPSFAVSQLDGMRQMLDGAAKPGTVIYNVFTSWCPSCREEAPVFAAESARLAREGVQIVGIDQGEPPQAVARFSEAFGIHYPIVIDPTSATTEILSARVIPETIVVRNGVVRTIAVGPVSGAFLDQAAGV